MGKYFPTCQKALQPTVKESQHPGSYRPLPWFSGVLVFLCLGWLALRPAPLLPQHDGPIQTLVIDAGHGGKDPGALGATIYEKEVTLAVAHKLRDRLQAAYPSMRVLLTREDDTFIPLHERGAIALEAGGDFFLSIHCNGLKNKTKQGAETYILGVNPGQENYQTIIAENEAILFEDDYQEMYGGFNPSSPEGFIYFHLLKNVFRQESSRLASQIQQAFATRGRVDRGVKQAPFVVLYHCGMPAVLTEIGFITHPEEERFLASDSGQAVIADGLFQAIEAYNQAFAAPGEPGRGKGEKP